MDVIVSTVVANNILRRSFEEKNQITPMKLQKLLYFVYRKYLQETGVPLFSERFEVWKYGPVLPNVQMKFNHYGDGKIQNYSIDAMDNTFLVVEKNNDRLTGILNEVWSRYRHYNGIELSKITQQEGSAWYKAFQNGEEFLKDDEIKNDTMY